MVIGVFWVVSGVAGVHGVAGSGGKVGLNGRDGRWAERKLGEPTQPSESL